MGLQRTIRKAVRFKGVGLHTGKRVRLELRPAKANTGVRFIRTDIDEQNIIEANVHNVTSTTRATSLGNGMTRVTTVEHLMSALYALGVDNVDCYISAEELPVLDGSSAVFVEEILKAGVKELNSPKRFIIVEKPVEIRDGDKLARITPASEFTLHYTINFDHPAIGKQKFKFTGGTDFFKEISRSRTFGFLSDVERMQAMGLALGGSLENTVVLDGDSVMNPDGLRYADEFVRHKVLDALGDFALCGHQLIGKVELHKAGHDLQTRLIRELLNQRDAYRVRSWDASTELDPELILGDSAFA